ncbi:unnamed protein product [Bathycoccus prasinos]
MYNYFTKPVKCPHCFGYNRRVCAHCQGRGKTTTTDDDDYCCSRCVGRGYVRCDACNGTGLKNGMAVYSERRLGTARRVVDE